MSPQYRATRLNVYSPLKLYCGTNAHRWARNNRQELSITHKIHQISLMTHLDSVLSISTLMCRKRTRDDTPSSSPIKKCQHQQIFSEAHTRTVKLMMEALRQQRLIHLVEEPEEEISGFQQKPFWPAITRRRVDT